LWRLVVFVALAVVVTSTPLPASASHVPHLTEGGIWPPFLVSAFGRYTHVKNDTGMYGTELSGALSDWNTQYSGVGSLLRVDQNGSTGEWDLWVFRSGYGEDGYGSAVLGIPSCWDYSHVFSNNANSAYRVSVFEQKWYEDPTFFDLLRYSRICVNHDSYSDADPYNGFFGGKTSTIQRRGLAHELGHTWSLDHRTDTSVMNTNLGQSVQSSDATGVSEYYDGQ
jgi:hypothetical protein